MTERQRLAQAALIAVCVSIEVKSLSGADLGFWVQEIEALLPDCVDCPEVLGPIRYAAETLVIAKSVSELSQARSRLSRELKLYYGIAAADRINAWREATR